jgi:hypothetical protein
MNAIERCRALTGIILAEADGSYSPERLDKMTGLRASFHRAADEVRDLMPADRGALDAMRNDIRDAFVIFQSKRPAAAIFTADKSLDEHLAEARAEVDRLEGEMHFANPALLAKLEYYVWLQKFCECVESALDSTVTRLSEKTNRPVDRDQVLQILLKELSDRNDDGKRIVNLFLAEKEICGEFDKRAAARDEQQAIVMRDWESANSRLADLENAKEFFPAAVAG